MPIELAIWKLAEKLERLSFSTIESESKLEDALCTDLSLIAPQLMLIGRQIRTDSGKFIDILAIDNEGNLVVAELKKDRTPREVVAQTLDYASWVQNLTHSDILNLFAVKNEGQEFEESYAEFFGESPPEKLNESHQLIVVTSELDPASERIIGYLSENYGVPINAVFFHHFTEKDQEYLARTWLIDPQQAESKVSRARGRKEQEPWNGRDYYVSFGIGSESHRDWEDAPKYGFISAGGGKWHTQTLYNLSVNDRVFVNVPGTGFVGVGIVEENACPASEMMIDSTGERTPLLEAPLIAKNMGWNSGDLEMCEHVVRVKWLETVSEQEAHWEKGMFAVQHTACKMRSSFTIERLENFFNLQD